jgi:hypothetical protein
MTVTDEPSAVKSLEANVGSPGDKWAALQAKVQNTALTEFAHIEAEWLET